MAKKLIEAAREFCRRVECGEVRSVRSYNAFKQALDEIDEQAKQDFEDFNAKPFKQEQAK